MFLNTNVTLYIYIVYAPYLSSIFKDMCKIIKQNVYSHLSWIILQIVEFKIQDIDVWLEYLWILKVTEGQPLTFYSVV